RPSGSRPVDAIRPYLESLAARAQPDGGWGYAPGQAVHLEPTALALLALSLDADNFRPALDRGKQAIDRCARADGTYRVTAGREEAVWPTALVLFVQAALGYPDEQSQKTAAALLALEGRAQGDNQADGVHDID